MLLTGRKESNCVAMSLVAAAWQDGAEAARHEGRPTKVASIGSVNETLNDTAAVTEREMLIVCTVVCCILVPQKPHSYYCC